MNDSICIYSADNVSLFFFIIFDETLHAEKLDSKLSKCITFQGEIDKKMDCNWVNFQFVSLSHFLFSLLKLITYILGEILLWNSVSIKNAKGYNSLLYRKLKKIRML